MAPRVVDPRPHTVTRSRSASRRTSPIPGTSPSSSTEPKPPCCSRKARIFAAVAGPTPATVSSCSGVAVLRLTFAGVAEADVVPAALPAGARVGTSTCLPVLDDGGEVHRGEIGAPRRASRAAHRIVDALAAPQPVDARMLHRTGHVHGDLAALPGGAAEGCTGSVAAGGAPGPPPPPQTAHADDDDRKGDRCQERDATGIEIGHGPDARQQAVTDQHAGVTARHESAPTQTQDS